MIKIGIFATRHYSKSYEVYDNQVGEDYLRSIELAKALPILIPYEFDKKILKEYINLCDGFLIPGGMDVDPSSYGEIMLVNCGDTDIDYDNYQINLINMIMETGKPILGICRGHQILNVALGGSLYQDIPSELETDIIHNQTNPRYEPCHSVEIDDSSFLYSLLGRSIEVNSKHHQSIKKVATGLEVVAVSSDGVIEAIEASDYPIYGVQWHPENFIRAKDNYMKAIFSFFVEECSK